MATTELTPNLTPPPPGGSVPLLISLPSLERESFDLLLTNLAEAFVEQSILVATPDAAPAAPVEAAVQVIGYTPAAASTSSWTLTAADFLNAHELARQHGSRAVLLLGAGAQTLAPAALHAMARAVLDQSTDLAVPCYELPARSGLVNSAILYPLTRALFGARVRFPLAIDLCLSSRALERLAATAQRFTAGKQPDAIQWPVIEAAVSGFSIAEVDVGGRALPQPPTQDFNTLLAQVAGSLFSEVESKAASWQRARMPGPPSNTRYTLHPQAEDAETVQPMLDAFRNAYGNLHEIWSLVLPPHSLLGLKRLSAMPAETFLMSDSLWARIVYDFVLAYRLRTINRGHLLGSLAPLYFAWVASHILLTTHGTAPEQHIEALAAAFESDKPYLVSRWRWPDRFNP